MWWGVATRKGFGFEYLSVKLCVQWLEKCPCCSCWSLFCSIVFIGTILNSCYGFLLVVGVWYWYCYFRFYDPATLFKVFNIIDVCTFLELHLDTDPSSEDKSQDISFVERFQSESAYCNEKASHEVEYTVVKHFLTRSKLAQYVERI